MSKARALILTTIIAGALALPLPAFAQAGYSGPRNPNNFLQNLETIGPNAQQGKADDELIREAKKRFVDADPRVRVEGLEKLRYVNNATDSTEILDRGLNDMDVRVRIKAIDVLGARGVNDVVTIMSQRPIDLSV